MSTGLLGWKPAPATVSAVRGWPTDCDTWLPTVAVKFFRLLPVPPLVLTEIAPVVIAAGAVAVIFVAELTVKPAAGAPLKLTLLAPVKPVPVIVTFAPIVPEAGEKLVTCGAAANADGDVPRNSRTAAMTGHETNKPNRFARTDLSRQYIGAGRGGIRKPPTV